MVELSFDNQPIYSKRFGLKKSISYIEIIELLKNLYKIETDIPPSYMVEKVNKNIERAKTIAILDKANNSTIWMNRMDNEHITKETVIESFVRNLYTYQMVITVMKK